MQERDALTAELEARDARIAQLETAREADRVKLAELEETLAQAREEARTLQARLAETGDALAQMTRARDALAAELEARDARIAELDARGRELAGRLEASEDTNRGLGQRLAALERRVAELDARRLELEASLEARIEERDRARRELADTRAELERARALVALKAAEPAPAGPAPALSAQGVDRRLEAQAARLAAYRKALQERDARVESLRRALRELSVELERVRGQRDSLRARLQEAGLPLPDDEVRDQLVSSLRPIEADVQRAVVEARQRQARTLGTIRAYLPGPEDVDFLRDNRIVMGSSLLFESGSTELRRGGRAELTAIALRLMRAIEALPEDLPWVLRIDGHTDSLPVRGGRLRSNWELSAARASAVAEYLIELGFPRERLMVAGFADTRPLVEGHDEEARRRNRRIELTLTAG